MNPSNDAEDSGVNIVKKGKNTAKIKTNPSSDDINKGVLLETTPSSSTKRVTRSRRNSSPVKKSLEKDKPTETKADPQKSTKKRSKASKSVNNISLETTPPKKPKTTPKKSKPKTSDEKLNLTDKTAKTSTTKPTNNRGRGRTKNRGTGRKSTNKNVRLWLPKDPIERAIALSRYHKSQSGETATPKKKKSGSNSDESYDPLEDINTNMIPSLPTSSRGTRGRGQGKTRGVKKKKTVNKNLRMWLPTDPLDRAIALSRFYKSQGIETKAPKKKKSRTDSGDSDGNYDPFDDI